MSYEHLHLHRERQESLQRDAREHSLSRAAADRRRAERLARRADRLLARSALLAGRSALLAGRSTSTGDLAVRASAVSLRPSL